MAVRKEIVRNMKGMRKRLGRSIGYGKKETVHSRSSWKRYCIRITSTARIKEFKTINLLNGWRLLTACKLFVNDKKRVKELINSFYNQIMILPFQKEELLRLIDKANITSERMRDTFITSFKRADDKGIMTPEEVADFLILELSGETDKSRDMAIRVAQKHV